MNSSAYATYKQYLKETNDVGAAANLTLADANQTLADVMRSTQDANAAEGSQTGVARSLTDKLTVKEIAENFKVKEAQVLGWIKSGDLPATDTRAAGKGRPTWRISPAQLAAFEGRRASGQTVPATTEPCPPRKARRRRQPGIPACLKNLSYPTT